MTHYTQRIEFIRLGTETDSYLGTKPVEESVLTTWASITQLQRSKALEQVQERINSSYRVRIHTRKGFDVTTDLMVKWQGKKFQIITGGYTDDVLQNFETVFDICQS